MISVIVPMKNSEAFLRQCIDSLLNQSYGDFEILLIDNGSEDSTVEIAMEYMNVDARIKVLISEEGAGDARNLGIVSIDDKSDYLLFVDSDDFFDEDMIGRMVESVVESEADVVVSKAYRYNHLTKDARIMDYQASILAPQETMHTYFTMELSDVLYQTTVASPWAKMFSRKLINKYGIFFQNIKNSNDISFVYLAMSLANKIVYISNPLVFYRTHHGSSCQGKKDEYPLECLLAYTELKEQLIKHKIFDRYKKTFMKLVQDGYKWNYDSLTNVEAKKRLSDNRKKFFDLVEGC